MTQHYFNTPDGPAQASTISIELAGRPVTLHTADGVFSGRRLDQGTAVLLDVADAQLPPPGAGNLLDLGCGYGPIALWMALQTPGATVWAVDVNDRALELTAANAAELGLDNVRASRPEDVPADVRFDRIMSNPPIRVGKQALHDILAGWLPRLTRDGDADLVVNRNLGADSLAGWLSRQGYLVEKLASRKGFRVLQVTATAGGAGPAAGTDTEPS
ncbi:class I SAM-dependent methyltransferase [Nakamurella aerolata]|uniref:Methyltransferase n=1 Tax=Nakamurella aerolata TaxID=1656892 RepID=A0A849A801_9ACTN|nr:methyltransferase [Nakamurella aerolata]NNG35201.1 methyltransferase [Nakamurella aerolata]